MNTGSKGQRGATLGDGGNVLYFNWDTSYRSDLFAKLISCTLKKQNKTTVALIVQLEKVNTKKHFILGVRLAKGEAGTFLVWGFFNLEVSIRNHG